MVCIAAFIILLLFGVVAAFLSIFKRDIGRRYWRVIKKAWGCVGKKVRLQKCQTNFKEDVKHSLLKKLVLTHPKFIKPISIAMEIVAIIIVLVFVWAILTSIKTMLALWTFGSCNVSKPSSCALSSEACSIDADEPKNIVEASGRWFTEWGEIFQAIPDRLHDWKAEDYRISPYDVFGQEDESKPYALDIFDPGCSACMQSYKNQKKSGFFDRYNTIIMIYPIQLPDGSYKFKNSGIIARYINATTLSGVDATSKILDKLYTESNNDGISYQSLFNNQLSEEEASKMLQKWLKEFGISNSKISGIVGLTNSEQVNKMMQQTSDVVNNRIHAKGIPTLIYDNKLHTGLYEEN